MSVGSRVTAEHWSITPPRLNMFIYERAGRRRLRWDKTNLTNAPPSSAQRISCWRGGRLLSARFFYEGQMEVVFFSHLTASAFFFDRLEWKREQNICVSTHE